MLKHTLTAEFGFRVRIVMQDPRLEIHSDLIDIASIKHTVAQQELSFIKLSFIKCSQQWLNFIAKFGQKHVFHQLMC